MLLYYPSREDAVGSVNSSKLIEENQMHFFSLLANSWFHLLGSIPHYGPNGAYPSFIWAKVGYTSE